MNDISVISRLTVQPVEPDLEASTDELNNSVVPVEEDALPQGVLDLLNNLNWRLRPMAGTGRGAAPPSLGAATGEVTESPVARPQTQPAVVHQRPVPLPSTPLQPLTPLPSTLLQPLTPLPDTPLQRPVALSDKPLQSPAHAPVALETAAVATTAVRAAGVDAPQPFSEQPSPAEEPAIPTSDLELRAGLPNVAIPRHVPTVALPVAAPTQALPSLPPPEVTLDDVAVSSRDFLQIPFNKGTASGKVTVTRMPGESTQNLLLSPSSAQVFEHLKEPFEQVRDTHWRLADRGDEQHQHPNGKQQTPDDEQAEQAEIPA